MQIVFKYPFDIKAEFDLVLPQDAKILHVEVQFGRPCIWALVKISNPPTRRKFSLHGTGHPIDLVGTHVQTFLTNGGNLVWHLFDHGENFGDI